MLRNNEKYLVLFCNSFLKIFIVSYFWCSLFGSNSLSLGSCCGWMGWASPPLSPSHCKRSNQLVPPGWRWLEGTLMTKCLLERRKHKLSEGQEGLPLTIYHLVFIGVSGLGGQDGAHAVLVLRWHHLPPLPRLSAVWVMERAWACRQVGSRATWMHRVGTILPCIQPNSYWIQCCCMAGTTPCGCTKRYHVVGQYVVYHIVVCCMAAPCGGTWCQVARPNCSVLAHLISATVYIRNPNRHLGLTAVRAGRAAQQTFLWVDEIGGSSYGPIGFSIMFQPTMILIPMFHKIEFR